MSNDIKGSRKTPQAPSAKSEGTATLIIDEQKLELPIYVGTTGEKVVDVRKVRAKTCGVTLFDEGLNSVCVTTSAIATLNGEEGILRYRGYSIEEHADECEHLEVVYMLLYGDLPTVQQLLDFKDQISESSELPEAIIDLIFEMPKDANPMYVLQACIALLGAHFPRDLDVADPEAVDRATVRLIALTPVIIALIYRASKGWDEVEPNLELGYVENFLFMMTDPDEEFDSEQEVTQLWIALLEKLAIAHADHEQNCSTTATRVIGSADATLYASIAGGIGALSGPLHGGAVVAVAELLEEMSQEDGLSPKEVIARVEKRDGFRLMGFGHRVYKNFDPRQKLIKAAMEKLLGKLQIDDPLFKLGEELEELALASDYMQKRNLYPNVDYTSNAAYRAMGLPYDFYAAMFAFGRMAGWTAHWREARLSESKQITRPRQLPTGSTERQFVTLEDRE